MTRLASLGISGSGGSGKNQLTSVRLDPSKTGREAESLDAHLRRMVIGQDEAIDQIVNIYQMHQTGLNPPGRPVGNFLFLGPTGTGKTRIVEAMAESLVGSPRAVVKIDCAEFQHSHEIAKLIGSPPGYLGHRETHPLLSQETINQHHTDRVKLSFILFDEIEKASDSLWNLLLGILDKATLTLGDNRKVDFSRALIFLTSNLGASEMASLLQPKLGFGLERNGATDPGHAPGHIDEKMLGKISRSGVEAARKKFTPEFMNRLDKVVVFQPLGEKQMRQILDIELKLVQQRVFQSSAERAFVFHCSDEAKDSLLRDGIDAKYGARHLKRAIERLLVQPLSNLIATDQIRMGDSIRVSVDPSTGQLTFLREAEGMSPVTMAQVTNLGFTQQMAVAQIAIDAESGRPQSARYSRR
ncbi:MAG: ATP-dependent Clp protease ATP-binding subunit [Acidobacteriaceae bacterium]|jgi:ATP-dependent Clp protease ATP-binding subunit ClpA|nr:ATP-dependent Clp protease ATP-binding subunit [Acidobacteriaceae bacterium]